MNTSSTLPLDAVIALARQKLEELVSIKPLDELVAGDRGSQAQAARVEQLLTDMHALVVRIRSEMTAKIREQESPFISVSPSHAEFLTGTLLPNANKIEKAYFHGSILAELVDDDELNSLAPGHTIRNAVWFTAEYTDIMMEPEDERHLNVDVAFGLLEQPWFQPDQWSANLRELRPVVVGVESARIPVRISARLSEAHRAFSFGAWMATIAMCRALIEFALIDRAAHFGYPSVTTYRDGTESYLSLEKLIDSSSRVLPALQVDLELLRESGNRILHPKRKRNVIPLPKVLRSEALSSIQAATRVVEHLYRKAAAT